MEYVGILFLLCLVAALCTAVYTWFFVPKFTEVSGIRTVRSAGGRALDGVTMGLVGAKNQTVERTSPSTLTVKTSYTEPWVVLVVVLFFPIGLVTLAAPKNIQVGTLSATDLPDGTSEVLVAGAFENQTLDTLKRVLDGTGS